MRRAAIAIALVGCHGAATPPPTPPSATPPPAPAGPSACDAPVHHAFDFWIGTWEVSTPDGTVVGHNTITGLHRGCALLEQWQAVRGATGTSLNFVDPLTGEWVQQWVDGDGDDIRLRGGLRDGAMVLDGTLVSGDGKASRLRGTWTPLDDGRVRQFFEESTDDGASWSTWFDGYYAR